MTAFQPLRAVHFQTYRQRMTRVDDFMKPDAAGKAA